MFRSWPTVLVLSMLLSMQGLTDESDPAHSEEAVISQMKDTGTPQTKDTATPLVKDTATPQTKDTATPLVKDTATPQTKDTAIPPVKDTGIRPMIEVKGGYFFFSDSTLRKVYNCGGLDVQLSGSYPVWKWLQIYGSVEYLQRSGRSLNAREKTTLWEVPLSLGLRPQFAICETVQYYFTLGPRYIFIHAHNISAYVDRNLSENGLGGFVNTGFIFLPYHHLLIDIFGEYSYKRMQFHPSHTNVVGNKVQIGGFTFGAGLGYAF